MILNMHKNKIFSVVLLFIGINFCFSSVFAAATPTVQATVDRNQMGQTDTLTLSISVSSTDEVNVSEPKIPNLSGFDIVNSWQSSSTSSKLTQGPHGMQFETVRRQDFNYLLTAQRQGSLTIPGFEVNVDGKPYTTKPIAIKVSGKGSGSTQNQQLPGQDLLDEEEEIFNQLLQRHGMRQLPGQRQQQQEPNARQIPNLNEKEVFFIQSEVDKTDVYEGEQIVVNWYIYTRGNILALDRVKFPDLKGFWKEIIEEVPALNFTQEIVNGLPYKRALLASHALFPIKPGVATIDEYKIKAQVQVPSNPYSAFGFGQAYTFQRASEPVKINVKPLPTEGRPSQFSGAVGQFDVHAQVEGKQFPVNQPFSLKVKFEGSGNAKLIELPSLQLPPTIEIYDTKSESKYFKNGKSFKEFEVLIIPREIPAQDGMLTIPAMSFAMFDTQLKKYVIKTTEAITVKIVQGSAVANSNLPQAGSAGTTAATKSEIKNIDVLPEVVVSWAPGFLSVGNQNILWLVLYVLVFIVIVWKAWRELGGKQSQADINKNIEQRMKKINGLIQSSPVDWRQVGAELSNSINLVLGHITDSAGSHLEFDKMMDLASPSIRQKYKDTLKKQLDLCQILSFAPEGAVGALKEPSQLQKNADEIHKTLKEILQSV